MKEETNLKNDLISAIMELTHEEQMKLLEIIKEKGIGKWKW